MATSTIAARMLRMTTMMRLSLAKTRRCGSGRSRLGGGRGCNSGGGGPSYLARGSSGGGSGTSIGAISGTSIGSGSGGGIAPVGRAPGGTLAGTSGAIPQASAFAATTTLLGQPTSAILQSLPSFSSTAPKRSEAGEFVPSSTACSESEAPPPAVPVMPTRHSRRQPPPSVAGIALPSSSSSSSSSRSSALLEAPTYEIISSRPGSLYSYDPNDSNDVDDAALSSPSSSSFFDSAAGDKKNISKGGKNKLSKAQEYDIGLSKSDISRQYVEWLLRGHAALVEGTVEHARVMVEMNASEADTTSFDEGEEGEVSSDTTSSSSSSAAGGAATSVEASNTAVHNTAEENGPSGAGADGAFEGDGGGGGDGSKIIMSPTERINVMMQLLERIEEEGKVYVALRARIKANQMGGGGGGGGGTSEEAAATEADACDGNAIAYEASSFSAADSADFSGSFPGSSSSDSSSDSSSSDSSSSDSSSSDSDSEDEGDEEGSSDQDAAAIGWRTARLIERYGAPPGPSIGMYDTVLDTIAAASASSTNGGGGIEHIHQAKALFDKAMMRHFQDGGPNANNIHTMPTAMTYNAVLRTCANVAAANSTSGGNMDKRVRDEALEVAFNIYDLLGQSTTKATTGKRPKKASNRQVVQAVQRNSATYAYMLQIVTYCIPPSETRGNIAYGLWLNATSEDEVLDDFVFKAYLDANRVGGSNGDKFDGWVDKLEKVGISQDKKEEEGGTKLPQKWWRNRNIRRMNFVGMEKMKMEQEGGMVMY